MSKEQGQQKIGKVFLVGAGPGDIGLLTVKARDVIGSADVIVYDALVGEGILSLLPPSARLIDAGKRSGNHTIPQWQMNELLLEEALKGNTVVRLKGGDPFVFGRGGEELELLAEHGIPFEVIPGVTSAFAVPAYNGIPVTHRDYTSSVHVITGHRRKGADYDIDFEALARTRGTLIFLMGVASLPDLMNGLVKGGMDPATPAAILEEGTTARQRRVVSTVGHLARDAAEAGIHAPAITVVGKVAALSKEFTWYERLPLAGTRILLTRPRGLSSRMAQLLREKGAEVLELPAIETVPRLNAGEEADNALRGKAVRTAGRCPEKTGRREEKEGADVAPADDKREGIGAREIKEKIDSADTYDWLIFTSPTGVRIFMDSYLQDHDIRALGTVKIAVIGEGSRKALKKYGINADFMPSVYDGETLGRELAQILKESMNDVPEEDTRDGLKESMKDLPEENTRDGMEEGVKDGRKEAGQEGSKKGMRVLIPRAAIGNEELVRELSSVPGLAIDDIPTYDTVYTAPAAVDERKEIEEGRIDYVVFTSASTVKGFRAAVGDLDFSNVKAVCIGRQTRAAADALGMKTFVSEKATMPSLVAKVEELAGAYKDGD